MSPVNKYRLIFYSIFFTLGIVIEIPMSFGTGFISISILDYLKINGIIFKIGTDIGIYGGIGLGLLCAWKVTNKIYHKKDFDDGDGGERKTKELFFVL